MHVHSFVPKPPLAVQNSTQIFHTANNEHCGGLEMSLECLKFEEYYAQLALNPGFPFQILARSFGETVRRNPEWKAWVRG